jgi:hypothetical protein
MQAVAGGKDFAERRVVQVFEVAHIAFALSMETSRL